MKHDYRQMLEDGFTALTEAQGAPESRLAFLGDHIFEFTTYDSEMSELFAAKALEVCAVVSSETTRDYIKDQDNYRWYLVMCNLPFFSIRLDWGVSIRGAWWIHEDQTLDSCGIWSGDTQVLSMKFTRDEWLQFIVALIEFAKDDAAARCAANQVVMG